MKFYKQNILIKCGFSTNSIFKEIILKYFNAIRWIRQESLYFCKRRKKNYIYYEQN